MDLKSKLNIEHNNKIENYALEFAESVEPKLVKAAQDGFRGFYIDFEDREDTHLLINDLFLKYLNELLDGCTAKIETTEHTNIIFKNKYYKSRLVISW